MHASSFLSQDYIVNVHGFPQTKGLMTLLLDDGEQKPPTFLNIVEAFKAISEESQPGDAVFVHFSGHGGRVLDAPQSEAGTYDEVIVPCDYEARGVIRDTLIFKTLLAPMRYGVTVTLLVDCCDTGMVVDLPYSWSPKSDKPDALAKLSPNDDFSFIRFLKVIKTLYETSTFTQLGKTVGSALKPSQSLSRTKARKDAAEKYANGGLDPRTQAQMASQITVFDIIADACKPTRLAARSNCDNVEALTCREDTAQQSLLEQVMNCTFMVHNDEDEYFSDDEDTFRTRTEDDVETEGHSFESLTDDEEDFPSKRRRGGRWRRNRSAR